MEETATLKKRIVLTRGQNIILVGKIKDYSTHIITSRPRLVDFVKVIAKEMGCEVSRHAVRETFLVLNKEFTEWPRKESKGKDRHKSRKTLTQMVKTVKLLGNVVQQLVNSHGAQGTARQIEQALADLEAVEKKNAPDLFAGVGT